MPWAETDAVKERTRFVQLIKDEEEAGGRPNLAEHCRRFGITRPTAYKWLERFNEGGVAALESQSRAPHHISHRTPTWVEDLIVQLRKERPHWGPEKLLFRLKDSRPEVPWPAASTIGKILERRGMVAPRKLRVRTQWLGGTLEGASEPNDVWAMDFKGHFALGNGSRCHPLTVTDLCTRYILKCEGLIREQTALVKPELEIVFREHGLPNRLRSDNGAPFSSIAAGGLCELSVWLVQLGVIPERIKPGCPQQNGSHERMHRTLKAETTKPPKLDLAEQQRAFDEFRAVFNHERPHEALGQRPPATLYSTSPRPFPSVLRQPQYPDSFEIRRSSLDGHCQFRGTKFFLSKALKHSEVGFEQIAADRWRVHYGPMPLGFIDERNNHRFVRSPPETSNGPQSASLPSAFRSADLTSTSKTNPESVNDVPG